MTETLRKCQPFRAFNPGHSLVGISVKAGSPALSALFHPVRTNRWIEEYGQSPNLLARPYFDRIAKDVIQMVLDVVRWLFS
jgi:hypothetical protein